MINNFAFDVKVILDGWPAEQILAIEPATAQLELGLGLSLAKTSMISCSAPNLCIKRRINAFDTF